MIYGKKGTNFCLGRLAMVFRFCLGNRYSVSWISGTADPYVIPFKRLHFCGNRCSRLGTFTFTFQWFYTSKYRWGKLNSKFNFIEIRFNQVSYISPFQWRNGSIIEKIHSASLYQLFTFYPESVLVQFIPMWFFTTPLSQLPWQKAQSFRKSLFLSQLIVTYQLFSIKA